MSQPTINDVTAVDPVLTNFALGYMQGDARFVAERVSTPVPVSDVSGTYYVFDKKYWFADEFKQRAPGSPYAEADFGLSTATYDALQWALSKSVADETRAANQAPLDLEQAAIRFLSGLAMIRKERLFAAAAMATSVWATDNTTATDWDDYSAGDPVSDFLTAKRTISQSTGQTPNTMVMGEIVADALQLHPDLIDRIKYTQAATAMSIDNALASIFGVSNFLVGKAIYNSANEYTTMTGAGIIDDDCLVCYVDPGAGVFGATAMKRFHWAPGGGLGGVRPLFRDEANDRDKVKFKMQFVDKVVATDLGYFFSDIV
jgi:hypothetical protein